MAGNSTGSESESKPEYSGFSGYSGSGMLRSDVFKRPYGDATSSTNSTMNRLRRRSSIYDNLHDLPEENENTGKVEKVSRENIMEQFDSMMEMLNEVRHSFEQEDTLRRNKKSSSTPSGGRNLASFIKQNYSDDEEDDDLPPLIIPSEGKFEKLL